MPAWLILIVLLAFPVAEAFSIFWLAGKIGWWALAWLAVAFFGGVALIRFERLAFAPRMLFSLQRGESPFKALFASTRLFMAGGLLIFPGLITDAMAALLLLIPGTWRRPPSARPDLAANDDVIEGEFTREESISDRFPRRDI
jgi:UPF0716 protein FxsA